MSSGIVSYMHCRRCTEKGRAGRYNVGLVDQWTLRVWCERCQTKVGDFMLMNAIQPRCDVCGEVAGPDHRH
jgi:hypothetical protein